MKLLRNISKELRKCNNNTPEFSLNGKKKICKVVSVYDGDSCRVVFDVKGTIYKWNVRMEGYDSPEMRPSRSNPNRDAEKKAALESKNFLKSLIQKDSEQLIYIECGEFDKYGRLLGKLFINEKDNVSVNQQMIDSKYGYVYNGGTKEVFKA